MAGVKGQKNPSKHKRINGWVTGTQEVIRELQTIAFRPKKGMGDRIAMDMQEKGLNKQQWCDEVINYYFGETPSSEVSDDVQLEETSIKNPLIQEAIQTAIATKQAALRAERKKKLSLQNQALMEKWRAEIEELEAILG